MMSKTDKKRVEQFLKENDPDQQEDYMDRLICQEIVSRSPEEILEYLNETGDTTA